MTLDLQSQISLTEKDEITLPLPLPYNGKVLTFEEVEVFLKKSIVRTSNLFWYLEQIGVQIVEFSQALLRFLK